MGAASVSLNKTSAEKQLAIEQREKSLQKKFESGGGLLGVASMNLNAVDDLLDRFPDLDLIFIESGGDNLAATFSPELSDLTIYVIDVSAGDKIPRKGGPGITKSDLLVINKTDLAPHVGADLGVMDRDAKKMRADLPFVFSNLKASDGLTEIVDFVLEEGMLN